MWDENKRPNAKSVNLERNLDEYQLIIIDEAYNYRNQIAYYDTKNTLWKEERLINAYCNPVNNSFMIYIL